jgi:hypothetical protein
VTGEASAEACEPDVPEPKMLPKNPLTAEPAPARGFEAGLCGAAAAPGIVLKPPASDAGA